MAQAKAKANDNAKAAAGDKLEQAAAALRKQGATVAIVCHTLGISYPQAQAMVAAWDEKHGVPKEIVRLAEGIKPVPGYPAVKDGRNPKAAKQAAAAKAKATPAKPVTKPADKPVAQPAQA